MNTTSDYNALFLIFAEQNGYTRKQLPRAIGLIRFFAWSLWNLPGLLTYGFIYGQEMERARSDGKAAPAGTDPQLWLRKWVALRASHFTKANRSSRAQVVRAMQQIHGIKSNERNQHVR